MNIRFARIALAAATVAMAGDASAQGKLNRYGNPPTVAPAPTSSAISVKDLQVRLYTFADDSMQGRQIGRLGNKKGTDYIAAELKKLGVLPAGDNGTYFQVLPYHLKSFTSHSRLTVDGNPLAWQKDWGAGMPGTARKSFSHASGLPSTVSREWLVKLFRWYGSTWKYVPLSPAGIRPSFFASAAM